LERQESLLSLMASSPRLQRQCACGAPSAGGGSCAACEEKASLKGLQRKALAIGAADDPLEREADQVAERVMRMEVPGETPMPRALSNGPMVASSGRGSAAGDEAPPSVHAALISPGQPLAPSERAFFEPRFGQDFSDVRVHTDGQAQQSARDVQALAYTVGTHLVFAASRYAPESTGGQRLLAHELTHVLQQRRHGLEHVPGLQRVPITRNLTEIPEYEWTGREQRMTARTLTQAYISLNFEPSTNNLTCTFRLRWRFPPAWPEPRRSQYISDFVSAVTTAWQGRFPLVHFVSGRATASRANVALAFDHVRAPDMGNETAYINWLLTPEGAVTRERWTMNVHEREVRARVDGDSARVDLEPYSNSLNSRSPDDYDERSYSSGPGGSIVYPPYQHYFVQGITPSIGTPPRGGYRQVVSAHEFGHMIGLADEYVVPAEDYQDLVRSRGRDTANREVRRRSRNSNRIQSAGNDVTRDAYAPFANFLSTLTAQDWRVG
jgi:hypothetical protein